MLPVKCRGTKRHDSWSSFPCKTQNSNEPPQLLQLPTSSLPVGRPGSGSRKEATHVCSLSNDNACGSTSDVDHVVIGVVDSVSHSRHPTDDQSRLDPKVWKPEVVI